MWAGWKDKVITPLERSLQTSVVKTSGNVVQKGEAKLLKSPLNTHVEYNILSMPTHTV